jgi:hypothetical protein
MRVVTGEDARVTPAQLAGALALRGNVRRFGEERQRYALRSYLMAAFNDVLRDYAIKHDFPTEAVQVTILQNNTADVHYYANGAAGVRHITIAATSLKELTAQINHQLLKPLGLNPVGYQTAVIAAMSKAIEETPSTGGLST